MGYNVSKISIVASKGFSITDEALGAVTRRLSDEEWVPDSFRGGLSAAIKNGFFPWHGDASGHGLQLLTTVVLPAFDGSADLVLCWERGDSYSGLRLRDHKVTKHEIVMSLGAQLKE